MHGQEHAASQQMNDPNGLTAAQLQAYRQRWPGEVRTADAFLALLGEADAFVRERLAGHFTASAWLVDRAGTRALLTHHRKLDRWLQPGGHAEGETDLRAVALKEAEEESGLAGLRVDDDLFDLDRHWIPAHRGVPGHWHYDARYVVRAGADEDFVVSDESHALAWRDINAVAGDETMDLSLRRMARKWLDRL
jgi:8-oxo-dGTP pyrophosphatase MutT (NUDIX family)